MGMVVVVVIMREGIVRRARRGIGMIMPRCCRIGMIMPLCRRIMILMNRSRRYAWSVGSVSTHQSRVPFVRGEELRRSSHLRIRMVRQMRADMIGMMSRFVEERRDMLIIERVADSRPLPAGFDEMLIAQ